MSQVLNQTKLSVQDFLNLHIEEQQETFLVKGLGFIKEGSKVFETSYDLDSNVSFTLELLACYNLSNLFELIKDYCHIDFYYSDYKYHVTLYDGKYFGSFSHYQLNTAVIVAFLLLKKVLQNN